jgi:nicotinamide-nucleotide amidase
MQDLLAAAARLGALLTARRETIVIAESSTGGLLSAALLSVPGASAYFLGGAVIYTRAARASLLSIPETAMSGVRPSTEAYARLLARTARDRVSASWALAETGASGPSGNRYGDSAGHCCLAVAGTLERAMTLETGSSDRLANMRAFAAAGLELMTRSLDG